MVPVPVMKLREELSRSAVGLLPALGALLLAGPAPAWAIGMKTHPKGFNRAPIEEIAARHAAERSQADETGMANISEKRDAEVLLLNWGAFPTDWLAERDEVGPLQEMPREAQIQMAFACAGIRAAKRTDLILIESSPAQLGNARKLKNYLVTQQGISPNRIKLVFRDGSAALAWDSWIHIRPQGVELPVAPTRALASWISDLRKPAAPNIAQQSLVTEEKPIRISQAAAIRANVEKTVADTRPSFLRDGRVRTQVSTEYLSVDGFQGGEAVTRASWLGFRVGGDIAVFKAPIFEVGFSGNVARSMLPMSTDALNANATSWMSEGFGILRANSGSSWLPEVRVGLGWMGNTRAASNNLNDATFLPSITGARARLELSTRVDGMFRLGTHVGGVAARGGYQVLDFGGSLSQRVWENGEQSLSARVALDAGIARATAEAAPTLTNRETWASFQVGLAASL